MRFLALIRRKIFASRSRSTFSTGRVSKNPSQRTPGASFDLDLSEESCRQRFDQRSPDTVVSDTASGLHVRATGPDPWVCTPELEVDLSRFRVLQISADFLGQCGHILKVYFATDAFPGFSEERSVEQRVPDFGGEVTLTYGFADAPYWTGEHLKLRLDLEAFAGAGAVELRRIRLLSWPAVFLDLVCPCVPPRPEEAFSLLLESRGACLGIDEVVCSPGMEVLDRCHPERLRQPLESAAIVLRASGAGSNQVVMHTSGDLDRIGCEIRTRDPHHSEVVCESIRIVGEVVQVSEDPGTVREDTVRAQIIPEVTIALFSDHRLWRYVIPLDCSRKDAGGLHLTGSREIAGVKLAPRFTLGFPEGGKPATGTGNDPLSGSGVRGNRTSWSFWSFALDIPECAALADLCLPRFVLGDPRLASAKDLAVLPGVGMAGTAAGRMASLFPDRWQIAWPCAYLEQNGVAVAVTWRCHELTPVFAAPDTRSGSGFNTLCLHFPERPAGQAFSYPIADGPRQLRVDGDLWTSRQGRGPTLVRIGSSLAREPQPPRPGDGTRRLAGEVLERSVRSLATTFRGPGLGLTLPSLGASRREEYFDPRSCLSLLAASRLGLCSLETEARDELAGFVTTEAGENIPWLSIGLHFPEHLISAIDALRRRSRDLLRGQRPDGSWPPRLPPGARISDPCAYSRTAAAIARPARDLTAAYLLGMAGERPIHRCLERLRDPALVPTGGQPWEFAPAVPDLLAAAEVARTWTFAHQAGIAEDGLDRALDWLGLGLTFFRLRTSSDRAAPPEETRLILACVPALGVTRESGAGILWYRHAPDDQRDWRGLSCPWVGLRFAEAIELWLTALRRAHPTRVAPPLLARISRAVLADAASLQRADGSIPDGFVVRERRETEALFLAPLDLAWHALSLLGASPRAAMVPGDGFVAVGVGKFVRGARAMTFEPSLPGPQALLVRGRCTVRRGGSELAADGSWQSLRWFNLAGDASLDICKE